MSEENVYKAPQSSPVSGKLFVDSDLEKMQFEKLKKLYYRSCNVGAIAGLIILGLIGMGFSFTKITPEESETMPYMLGTMGLLMAVAVIGIVIRSNWGRAMGIIVSCFMLINIPMGTIVGIFGLFAFIKGKELFGVNRIKHGDLKRAFKARKAQGEK